MADPIVSDVKYSQTTQPGDGSKTNWEFNFAGAVDTPGYISKAHVKAFRTNRTTLVVTEIPVTTDMWLGPNTISVVPPVPASDDITIYRDTPKDSPLVNYITGSVINETNLDMANRQSVYVAAEMVDQFLVVKDVSDLALATANTALATSEDAVTTADAAQVAAANAVNISSSAQAAAAAAVLTAGNAAVDASNALSVANAIDGKATTALANSVEALDTANGIDAKATTALSNSVTALGTADTANATALSAKSTAEGIDAKATSALSTANSAVATANTAVSIANSVDAKATSALDTAASAVSLANSAVVASTNATTVANNTAAGLATEVSIRTARDLADVGVVKAFYRTTAPAGHLICDGSEVSRATYPDLFGVIGTLAGTPSTNLVFKLPDLRGEFIRGVDLVRGVDPGRSVGSAQTDAMQGHNHASNKPVLWGAAATASPNSYVGTTTRANSGTPADDYAGSVTGPISDGTNGLPRTATETRPRNVALLMCIRY